MLPAVSVGIPTYNRSGLLRQAIRSVLQQTYQEFELIISDDCSPDDTADVVASFRDPRLRYHRTGTNVRPPRNWNECVRLARGEFFGLLPDDDVYCPGFLAEMVAVLRSNPNAGFAQCAFYSVDMDLRCIRTRQPALTALSLSGEEALGWQLRQLCCVPAALLFRRAAMLEAGLWRESEGYWDDWAFIVRVAYRHGLTYVPRLLSCSRVHGQNLNRQLHRQGRDAILDLLNQQADVFADALPLSPALEVLQAQLSRNLSQHCVLLALGALKRHEWSLARLHFKRARRLYALAGFDPGVIKLAFGLLVEARRESRLRHAAREGYPVVTWDESPHE